MQQLDERLVEVGIEVNGQLKKYRDLNIVAEGIKFANANQNECTVKISNVDKDTQNFILNETSPFNKNKTPKILTLSAGRKSTDISLIFSGDIVSSTVSQPPDTTITLKCATANFKKGDVISRSEPGESNLSTISKNVASDLELNLSFQATDKSISNYSFSGGSLNQVDVLGQAGNVDVFVDNDKLIVKDSDKEITNSITVLSSSSGMIGIPETTEHGIKVKFLIQNIVELGGLLRIESEIYQSVNGDYIIYQLGFNITNRDVPFYWVASAKRK